MTNKFYFFRDGNQSSIAPDQSTRCHRLVSLSLVSRQSVLPILLLFSMLFFGIGNAWGAIDANSTWTETAWASIPNGATFIIANNCDKAMYNGNGTSSAPSQVSISYNSTTRKITVNTSGKSLDDIAWIYSKPQTTVTIKSFANNTKNLYTTSDNDGLRVGTTACTYSMGSGGKLLVASTCTRYVGTYSTTQWRSYTSETANNYGNSCSNQTLTFYVLDEASCDHLTMSTVTAAPGDTRIDLSWPVVENANSYTVTCKKKSDNSTTGISIGNIEGSGPKTCAITGLTNGTEYTWSVMPVGTGSYCAENTPATGDATPNPIHTITYYDKDGSHTITLTEGANIANALNALYGINGPTSCDTKNYEYFVGWKDGEISNYATSVTLLKSEVANSTTAAKTYYAVWSDKDPSASSWEQVTSLTIGDEVIFVYGTGKWEMTGVASSKGTATSYTTNPAGTYLLTIEAGNADNSYAFKNGSNYLSWSTGNSLTTSTSVNNASSWTINTSLNGNFKFSNVGTSDRLLQFNSNSGQERWACYTSNQKAFQIYKQASANANYITTCCTKLGTINGSFYETHPTSVVLKWDKNSNYGNWAVTGSGTIGDIETTTISAVDYWTCEVTGLSCNTEYEFTVTADPVANSGYCDGSWKISGTTSKFSIEKANSGNVKDGENNTIGTFAVTGNLTEACNTTAISLTYEVTDAHYQFKAWNVHKKNDTNTEVTVTNNQFSMPAYDVVVDLELEEISNPTLTPSVDAVNFGNQEISTTSSAQTISISGANLQGGVAFEIIGTDASAFAVTSPASSPIAQASAEAQGGQSVQITFTPGSTKTHSATLRFTSTNATTREVSLSGTGVNLWTVTFDKGTGVCATSSAKQTLLDPSVTLPSATPSTACAAEGWEFAGWSETNVSTETETAPTILSGSTYTPTENKTLYAVYSRMAGEPAAFNNEAGQYRIYVQIGEDKYYATGTVNSSKKIASTTDVDQATVYTFEKIEENANVYYAIKTGDDYITYANNSNSKTDLGTSASSYKWTISTQNVNGKFRVASQVSGRGLIFQSFNSNSQSTKTFAGYATSNVTANSTDYYDLEIESTGSLVYHKSPSCTGKATLTYDANGGTNAPDAVEYDIDDDPVVAGAGSMALAGHSFVNWNTKANGEGTTYAAGATITNIKKDMTLYAQWSKLSYTVKVTDPGNGNAITAPENNASVEYDAKVTLTSDAAEHWSFTSWTVTKDGDAGTTVDLTDEGEGVYSFNMPAYDVAISATFTETAKRNVKFYSNGTQIGTTQEVYVGEAPVAETAVYEDCLEGSNSFYGWTTAEWAGAIASTAGKTVETGALPEVVAGEGDVNYYAVWAKGTSTPTTSYAKITSAEDLTTDDYVIAYSYNNGEQIVLKNEEHANPVDGKLAGFSLALSESKYSNPDNAYIWTLQAQNDGSYYIYNAAIEKYVNATTTAATLSATPTKFTLDYNTTDSRWIIKIASNIDYAFHGYVTSSNNTITDRDFRVSTSPISHNSASKYRIYLYKNEKETSYSEFRTNCCGLKPVTNVTVDEVTASSVTLAWTAPSSTTGITKLQIVNADNGNVLTDNISPSATGGTVTTGLTECVSINLKVVSYSAECSSNSNVVAAIPQDDAKTVTFDYNEGTGTPANATTPCGGTTINLPATPTRDGYRFMGWNDGTQTLAVNATTYTPESDVTLTAQWAQLFTITYDLNEGTLSPAPSHDPEIAGESVELVSGTPAKGFQATFTGWEVSYIDANEDKQIVDVNDGAFIMPAANVTIKAIYDEIVGQWILLNDASELAVNDKVVIAAHTWDYAISTTQNTNNRADTQDGDIEKSGSVISVNSDRVQIFQLEESDVNGAWAFKCLNGGDDVKNKYIYAASTSSNHLKTQANIGTNGAAAWTIATNNGVTTMTANLSGGHNLLQYNSTNNPPMFSAYSTAQSGGAIDIYVFREGTFYAVNMPSPAPVGGTLSTNKSMAKAGETVTLTFKPSRGYKVKALSVSSASGDIAINPALEEGVTEYTFTMPAEAVTVAASFDAVPPVDYNLVTDEDDLAVGVQFLIVSNETNGYRAASTRNGEYLYAISIEDPETNTVSITTEDVVDFVLSDKDGDNWVISSIEGKLSATAGGNISYNGDNDKWGISISEGDATITNGSYKLRYNYNNGTTPRFKTYSNNTGEIPALYALPYTTYNFTLSGCKTIKVVTGYTYTYTIKNTDVPSSTPSGYEFLNKWTDGINTYAVGDAVEVSAAMTLQPCWKVTTPEATQESPATVDAGTLPVGVQDVVVTENVTLNVTSARSFDNLTVQAGGKVTNSSNKLTVNNLYIKSEASKSGQVANASAEKLQADAIYMDVTFFKGANTLDETTAGRWYMISAPFDVNLSDGFINPVSGETMTFGQTDGDNIFDLFEYDGKKRGETGVTGWKRVQGKMKAGTACLIGFNPGQPTTIRLKAASAVGEPNKIALSAFDGDATNQNWNGVANPTLHYTNINKDVQTYNNEDGENGRKYIGYSYNSTSFVVGTAFFVQATGQIDLSAATHDALRAPKRESERYEACVQIFRQEATEFADQMYVRASETATNEYEQGHDMITWNGTTANTAMIWAENYGKRLAIEEAPLVNNQASYALGIYAPKAGTYRIAATSENEGDLYLTQNGSIIWNLSMGAYELELTKGTTEGYGLLLQAKAPGAATGVDNIDASEAAQKVIINDHVYILRNGQMYGVDGKTVK